MPPGNSNDGATGDHVPGNASMKSAQIRSAPLKDKSNTHGHPNNPFRQPREASKVSLTRSISQGTENSSSSAARKNAPPRAVFHDLPTAHSSITSGTARGKGRDTSNNLAEILDDDENSVLLQEVQSPQHHFLLQSLPLPHPSSATPGSHHDEPPPDSLLVEDRAEHGGTLVSSPQPDARDQPGSMFSTIKNALVSMSSPITASEKLGIFTPRKHSKGTRHSNSTERRKSPTRLSKYEETTNLQSNLKAETNELEDSVSQPTQGFGAEPSSVYRSSREDAQSSSLPQSSPKVGASSSHGDYILPRPKALGSYIEVVRMEDLASTPAGREQSLQLPPPISGTRIHSNDISSLPDGSTVGNIYKHYVGSVSDDGEQSDLDLPRLKPSASKNSGNDSRPSALLLRKQRRAERAVSNTQVQPPQFALPTAPSLAAQREILTSSQGIGNSSSYGDTYNLLEITQREHWTGLRPAMSRSEARNDLRSDFPSPAWGESSPRTPFTSNNPFLSSPGPQVIISRPTDGDTGSHIHISGRQPLEREVSNALRRASGISVYSNGSISSSVLRYAEYHSDMPSSDSIGCLRRQNLEDTPVSDSGSVDGNGVDHVQAFYNQGAIAPNWINNQQNNNAIRIPINHNGLLPDSPPRSPRLADNSARRVLAQGKSREADDVNDWETIGDSALGGDYKESSSKGFGMLGGTVGQAGSSIANTSDDGTASTYIPDIDNYGSTERIIQHPGHTKYLGDYRRRDLKQTRTPVFLPEFREHKVNGYLADSNRTRPPINLFNYSPHPLDTDHEHPFKSPPPERMPAQKVKASPNPRNLLSPKPYSEINTLQTSDTEISEMSSPEVINSERANNHSRNTHNWMDDFGEPGPAICAPHPGLRAPSPQRHPSSNEDALMFARESATPVYIPNGKSNLHSGLIGQELDSGSKFYGKLQVDGLAENGSVGKKRVIRSSKAHSPLVKGPPGAFFRGILHSKPASKRGSHAHGCDGQTKSSTRHSSTKIYPTNTLRPLSLLDPRGVSAPSTPTFKGHRSSEDDLADFIYRSPLAPPRRFSSQRLYSGSKLLEIKEAARADGYEMRVLPTADSRTSSKDVRAKRHILEIPRLFPWAREPSARTDLCQERKKLSITALCFCNIFPPLLFLYGLGRLDGLAHWWSGGEISRFGKGQKRWAYILLGCWSLATFFGLVAFLVYWFSFAH